MTELDASVREFIHRINTQLADCNHLSVSHALVDLKSEMLFWLATPARTYITGWRLCQQAMDRLEQD